MEHQKIINFLDNTPNELSKFRTRNSVEINDESQGTYNASKEIKLKISMIRSNLCDYSDAYIDVKGTIDVPNTGTAAIEHEDIRKSHKQCFLPTVEIKDYNVMIDYKPLVKVMIT